MKKYIKKFSIKNNIPIELSDFLFKCSILLKNSTLKDVFQSYELSEYYDLDIELFWKYINIVAENNKGISDLNIFLKINQIFKINGKIEDNLNEEEIKKEIDKDINMLSTFYKNN
jgi:hypothetical protein